MRFLRQPFGSILAQVLIVLLAIAGILITQGWSKQVYQVGLILLIVAALFQIGVGNIPPEAGLGQSLRLVGISLVVIAIVFGLGFFLVPYLVAMGG